MARLPSVAEEPTPVGVVLRPPRLTDREQKTAEAEAAAAALAAEPRCWRGVAAAAGGREGRPAGLPGAVVDREGRAADRPGAEGVACRGVTSLPWAEGAAALRAASTAAAALPSAAAVAAAALPMVAVAALPMTTVAVAVLRLTGAAASARLEVSAETARCRAVGQSQIVSAACPTAGVVAVEAARHWRVVAAAAAPSPSGLCGASAWSRSPRGVR